MSASGSIPAGAYAFKSRAETVQVLPGRELVMALTQLEDEHYDHGRRLQAEGVRSAIALVQRAIGQGLQAHATEHDAPARDQGTPGVSTGTAAAPA